MADGSYESWTTTAMPYPKEWCEEYLRGVSLWAVEEVAYRTRRENDLTCENSEMLKRSCGLE